MSRILVADDEKDFRAAVAEMLRGDDHDVTECANTEEALSSLKKMPYDAVLADLRMPGEGGLEVLRLASSRLPDCVLVVMTAYGSMDTAIEAMRLGAQDFLHKPINLEALMLKLKMLLNHQKVAAENVLLRRKAAHDASPKGLVGESEGIRTVHRLVNKVGPADTFVLITGETGTGKELVARAVHETSPRKEEPFVPINCGSIPETLLESELFGHVRGSFTGADRDKRGLFEVAGKGTIFLDEIGELPLSLQPKLLRVLEAREILRVGSTTPIRIFARVVAATHRDLKHMAAEGKFRSDLLYRLNVFEIPVPPLRERGEDVQLISKHLLERICTRMTRPVMKIDPQAMRILERYRWPGNVRELSNVLERAVILADDECITLAELAGLDDETPAPMENNLKRARHQFEREHIIRVIRDQGGDKRKAAEALGIDLSSLYRKLQNQDPEQ